MLLTLSDFNIFVFAAALNQTPRPHTQLHDELAGRFKQAKRDLLMASSATLSLTHHEAVVILDAFDEVGPHDIGLEVYRYDADTVPLNYISHAHISHIDGCRETMSYHRDRAERMERARTQAQNASEQPPLPFYESKSLRDAKGRYRAAR